MIISFSAALFHSEVPTERSESERRRARTPSTYRDSGSEGDYSLDSFESDSRTATPTESISRSRRKSRRHKDSHTESYRYVLMLFT